MSDMNFGLPIVLYACPGCGKTFRPGGSHQHADGSWVSNSIVAFYQQSQWQAAEQKKRDDRLERIERMLAALIYAHPETITRIPADTWQIANEVLNGKA